jgi:hypothetical protein
MPLVVVVGHRLARVGIVANTRRSVPAERRRDHADVDVFDRVEVGDPHGAFAVGPTGADLGGRHGVDAHRIDEAADEIGDGGREDGLLVGHRRRVVDHEKEVDLRDRPAPPVDAFGAGVGTRSHDDDPPLPTVGPPSAGATAPTAGVGGAVGRAVGDLAAVGAPRRPARTAVTGGAGRGPRGIFRAAGQDREGDGAEKPLC